MGSKLIVALDFSKQDEALALVNQLNPELCALKVGSEMFSLFGKDFVRQLINKGFRIFLDLKFHDIPNTVAQACRACAELGVWMINVHASGGMAMMQAARNALEPYSKRRPLLIAVTVLTSMSTEDLPTIGLYSSLEAQVERLAVLARDAGLDGVVCSALEVPMLKKACGPSFLTITPGIRLPGDTVNDQSRVVTPGQAVSLGTDFIVVGRSITRAAEPAKVAQTVFSQLTSA